MKRIKYKKLCNDNEIKIINKLNKVKVVQIVPKNDIDERIFLLIEKIFKPWYYNNVEIKSIENKISKDPLALFKQSYSYSINNYHNYIMKAVKLSHFMYEHIEIILITAIIYLDKFKQNIAKESCNSNFLFFDYHILYLFITSLCLSIKYHCDDVDNIATTHIIEKLFNLNLHNKYYLFEKEFLFKVNYDLYISDKSFLDYYEKIV